MDEFMETPMEKQEEILTVDFLAREQLAEAARWAKFLAIMGFIGCGIIVVVGGFITIMYSNMNRIQTRYPYSGRTINTVRSSAFIGIFYLIIAVIGFVGCLYLFRFAHKMKTGLHERSQAEVNESFTYLKKLFRYHGIMTIVVIALYVVVLFAGVIVFLNR